METSLFLAKLIGPILVIAGVGLLLNRDTYRTAVEQIVNSWALIFVMGALDFAGGLAIALTHNVWAWNWPVIITLIGWLMIVRGALRILFPQAVADLGARILARSPQALSVSGAVSIVLGAILFWKGFA